MYWVMIALILTQFLLLLWRGVGLLPVWILIEYLQLVSFMPIYNFKFIPYLYDAFKPALVSHMIIFDETPIYDGLDKDFFNINYENYWLSVGRLGQGFVFYIIFLFCIMIGHLCTWFFHKLNIGTVRTKAWVKRRNIQFRYNVYIRYYMLVYFDVTFFSVMKIIEGNNKTNARKTLLLLSYILFVVNIVAPVILITLIYRRFDILKIKEAKQSFNTLLLRLDKASKVRVAVPAYFFLRRCLTACLLTLPIDNTFIFLQYVFILMSSHAFVLFMVAIKPYQTSGINWYVLANETFYSTLIIAMFIFSDATPELAIKFGAAVALISALVLIVVANLLTNIVYMFRGKAKLKEDIRAAKKKRAEQEALERAEEEDRKIKRKKEEEEFMRLPDETQANMSIVDNSTTNAAMTLNDLQGPSTTKKSKSSKNKKADDNVVEMGGTITDDQNRMPQTKKRRRNNKTKQDDVVDGQEPVERKKKKKKRAKDNQDATETTTQ
jgi:hypothetical protein